MGSFTTLQDKIVKTLRGAIFDDRDEGQLKRVQLCDYTTGGDPSVIQDWPIPDPKNIDIDAFVAEIASFAQETCDGLGETKRFIVVCQFGVALTTLHQSLPFTVKPTSQSRALARRGNGDITEVFEDEDDDRFFTTARGYKFMLAVAVKNGQDLHKLLTNNLETILEHHRILASEQAIELRHYREKHLDTMNLLEELVTKKHEREIIEKREIIRAEREAEAWKMFTPLVPTIINKIAGRKILAEKTIPVLEIMRELMSSMKPEQMQKLAANSGLTPPQIAAVFEIYETFAKEYQENQEAAKKKALETASAKAGNGIEKPAN